MLNRPNRVGEPCWTPQSVTVAVSPVAVLDDSKTHYFLATHAPIRSMRDERTREELTEEAVYKRLFKSARSEVLAAIIGPPGTGKSHLVNWLKLRCDEDLSSGHLNGVLPILVRRRTGTLRDALRQLIDQLPTATRKYLKDLEGAIVSVSAATSREKLLNEIQLELGPRGKDRGIELPRSLKQLHQVCLSAGFRKWLVRPDGTVARIVAQLSESHDVAELGSALPEFAIQDFNVPQTLRSENSPAVLALMDEFEEDPVKCKVAAKTFNSVLPNAIREMTGLGGSKLRDILDNIRGDLRKSNQTLALFIEDVSVMKVLDAEVLNALEPQGGRSDLCGMIAVLGMIEGQYRQLQDNQEQRISEVVSVGAASVAWREDADAVASFTARYLNAMRLSEADVKRVAEKRKTANDVTISACTKCPVKDECHQSFGKVSLGSVDVGLFPFTAPAPQALLNSHVEPKKHTQRGFLVDILEPLTRNIEIWDNNAFPPGNMQVRFSLPSYWTVFETRYCAAWDDEAKLRLRRLVDKWTVSVNAEEALSNVQPLLDPLRFPTVTKARKVGVPGTPTPKKKGGITPPSSPPQVPTKYTELRNALSTWESGGVLQRDQEFRQLLADLIRNGIAWDESGVPIVEVERHLGTGSEYEFISIEGMKSKVNKKFLVLFPRTQESSKLIDALLKYQYEGNKSWAFADSDIYKRVVHDWLRRHNNDVVSSFQPKGLASEPPVKSALQVLAVASVIREHSELPVNPSEALEFLLRDSMGEYPAPISEELQRLMPSLQSLASRCREFIFNELDVPQGSGSTVFINPVILLDALTSCRAQFKVDPIAKEYFLDFWETRYSGLKLISTLSVFPSAVAAERRALSDLTASIASKLVTLDLPTSELEKSLERLKSELNDLSKTATEEKVCHAGNAMDDQVRAKLNTRIADWVLSFDSLNNVLAVQEDLKLLGFSPQSVSELGSVLSDVEEFVENLEKETRKQADFYNKTGDSKTHVEAIKSALETLCAGGNQ